MFSTTERTKKINDAGSASLDPSYVPLVFCLRVGEIMWIAE